MPNLDVAKIALIVLLVAALVGVGVWFMESIAPDIIQTGVQATAALEANGSAPWGMVVALFGPSWGLAWQIALGFVVLTGSVFLIFRVIRWLQG